MQERVPAALKVRLDAGGLAVTEVGTSFLRKR
jgi:hypothetical protein